MDYHHPVVQSVLQPVIVAFAFTGIFNLIGGPRWGVRLASAAVIVTLLIAVLQLLGMPPWLPRTGMQKLPYVVFIGLLLGIGLETQPQKPTQVLALGLVWLALVHLWLAWPQLRNPTLSLIVQFGALLAIAALIFWRMVSVREQDLTPVVMTLLAAIGVAGVAFLSGSLSIAQLSAALAAALGGFALWSWPKLRFPFGTVGIVGVGSALLALAALTLFLTDASPIALTMLVLVFFANTVSARLTPKTENLRGVLDPVFLALVAAIPVALAMVLAQVYAPTDNDYYQ